ncbi:MAG: hypothetical protein CMB80_01350 [Flammeovirgaceae bacterium]|nr:hypothetical protein [Flammeovirgaceae bacterium]
MSDGMNMDRFAATHDRLAATSGTEFSNIPKLVVANGLIVRLLGDFQSNWEHFVHMPTGPRPYYCEGPDSDCPLCRCVSELTMRGDDESQKLGGSIKAKEKFYFNCLDRSDAGKAWHASNKQTYVLTQNEKGFSIGSMLLQSIGSVVKMRQQQGQNDDPNCYDLLLQKTGSGMQTKYSSQFTGDVSDLTDEEAAYKMWPLDQIARITAITELQGVASFVLGDGPAPGSEVNPSEFQAGSPVEYPPPFESASPPAAAPAPASAPTAAPTLTPVAQHQDPAYQDTTPGRNVDMSSHMEVPCSNCSAQMLFSMEDTNDLKCHACGTVFTHPTKS